MTPAFEVKNIPEGAGVNVSVWEHDEDNAHDQVCDLSGVVKDGWVEIPWKVVYMEDNDDSTSAKELAEKGYTLPEYHFVAEYDGAESEMSKVLEVKGWVKNLIKNKITGAVLTNRHYTMLLPNGVCIQGTTDKDGRVNETGLP